MFCYHSKIQVDFLKLVVLVVSPRSVPSLKSTFVFSLLVLQDGEKEQLDR